MTTATAWWPLSLNAAEQHVWSRSALTGQQKLHHANHGLDVMCIGLRALCFPLAAAAAASMVAHHERIQMPSELWVAATCLLVGSFVLRWLICGRRSLRRARNDALFGW